MARSTFGGEITHLTVAADSTNGDALVVAAPGTVVELYDARTGGTLVDDFLLWDNTSSDYVTPATQIEVDASGHLPDFQGPDGVTALYDADGNVLLPHAGTGAGEGTVTSVNGVDPDEDGDVELNADNIGDGSTKKLLTATERTKLGNIETGATANSANEDLLHVAVYAGGTANRKTADPDIHVFWICTTAARPPEVTSGTGGSHPLDIVSSAV